MNDQNINNMPSSEEPKKNKPSSSKPKAKNQSSTKKEKQEEQPNSSPKRKRAPRKKNTRKAVKEKSEKKATTDKPKKTIRKKATKKATIKNQLKDSISNKDDIKSQKNFSKECPPLHPEPVIIEKEKLPPLKNFFLRVSDFLTSFLSRIKLIEKTSTTGTIKKTEWQQKLSIKFKNFWIETKDKITTLIQTFQKHLTRLIKDFILDEHSSINQFVENFKKKRRARAISKKIRIGYENLGYSIFPIIKEKEDLPLPIKDQLSKIQELHDESDELTLHFKKSSKKDEI